MDTQANTTNNLRCDDCGSTFSVQKTLTNHLNNPSACNKEKEFQNSQKLFDSALDPTQKRGISSKKTTADLFDTDDLEEHQGITIWSGDDVFEDIDNIE